MKPTIKLPNTALFQKRMPTLIGVGILVIGLISGTLLFSNGTGVFAPRASAETTPRNIKVTNVTNTSFTVSFLTDLPTIGFVKYGDSAKSLKLQTSDDRNQLSGSTAEFALQHITVRGLTQNTTYYYVLGTDGGATFDNAGQPFSITTAKRSGAPAAAKTIYGTVTTESGAPADGAVVYIKIPGAGDMSSLVKSSGSWAVPLSNARVPDGSAYATIDDTTTVSLDIQGKSAAQKLQFSTTVKEAQPVVGLAFGTTPVSKVAEAPATAAKTEIATLEVATETAKSASASARGQLTGLLGETVSVPETSTSAAEAITELDVDASESATVTTGQPTIVGSAPANVVITVEIHSDTAINHQLTSNENGEFEINVAELGKTLEPGEHTITYSYTDPTTGKLVTKTKTFTVANTSTQLAQAQPYGTQNPYPVGGASSSASTATGSASTKGGSATNSATSSARSSMPATTSAVPVSGSVGTTLALIIGGLFFIVSGSWSFWIASQLAKEEVER
ncbi:MAG: fibronectin type III domain-containing protein [bacterium]|nr:fibronectin type III domain-containing protein [bacterium]